MAEVRIGVTLPTAAKSDSSGVPDVAAAARHAEQLGFESVWTSDLIVGDGSAALEASVVLAGAAAATRRVLVGFGVLALPSRPIAWTAAQIATLQHLSGNRVLLGVGSGMSAATPFWRAVGAPRRARGRRTDEALDVLPRLIAGEPTRLEREPDRPTVALAPGVEVPPILVGSFRDSDASLRRAVAFGDGWFPSLLGPDGLAAAVAKLADLSAKCGRAAPGVTFGAHVVPGTDAAARSAVGALVSSMVDDHRISPDEAAEIPIAGDRRQVAERLSAYHEAGAERLVISPDGAGWERGAEFVAEACALL